MKSLRRPSASIAKVKRCYDALSKSRRAKIAPLIVRDRTYLRTRFDSYESICADVGSNKSRYDGDKTATVRFIALYNDPPAQVDCLKTLFTLSDEIECPYCGGPTSPETLDHYLEKAVFPEFSLFPLNLIPVCRRCNPSQPNIKNGSVRKIHPYLSDISNRVSLTCEMDLRPEITFTLHVDVSQLSREEEALCRDHIQYLSLNDRFKKFAELEWRRYRRSFRNAALDVARQHFENEIRSFSDYSANHWKVILYREFIRSADNIRAVVAP